jgi:hypothetical protein
MARMKAVPITNPAVLASLEGDNVPPAFPRDLRRTLGLASSVPELPQLPPAEELDKLFPAEREVTVQRLVGKDANGRKKREPLTIILEEATVEECAAIARPLQKLADAATDKPVGTIIHEHLPEAIEAINAATGVDEAILRGLKISDLTALAEAIFEVNAGFFVRRLPLLMMKFQGVVGRALSDGRISSPTSTETASPSLNS